MNIEAIIPKDLAEAQALALAMSKSALVPDSLKGKPENCLIVILNSLELGLLPMQGSRMFAIINGKMALTADGIAALVMKRRDVCESLTMTELTDERCTYVAKRSGAEPVPYTFTFKDAEKAGLVNHMYKKYPKPMLRARCISAICKAVFPDLAAGLYEDDTGEITGNVPARPYPPEEPQKFGMLNDQLSLSATAREPGEDDGVPGVDDDKEMAGPTLNIGPEPTEMERVVIAIGECQSLQDLVKLVPRIQKLTKDDQKFVRAPYAEAKAKLEAQR